MFGERLDLAVISDGKSPGTIPLGDIVPAYQQEGCTCCGASGASSSDFSRVMQRTVSKLGDRGIIGDQEGETRQMIQDAGYVLPDDSSDFSDEITFLETITYGDNDTIDVYQNSRTGGYQTVDNKGVVSGTPGRFTYTPPEAAAAYSMRKPARYNSMAVRKMLENRKKKQGLDLKIRKAAAAFGIKTPVLPWYVWIAVVATIFVVIMMSLKSDKSFPEATSEELGSDTSPVMSGGPVDPLVGLVPSEPLGEIPTVSNLIGR